MSYQPIENYGIIGDQHTVAMVGMDGSIDMMCFPRFDSPTIFAAMLDHKKGGFFRIHPLLESPRHKQIYLPDTNVLITRFLSSDGIGEVSDFMPVEETGYCHNLVRRAKCVHGEITFRMECAPRFDYARTDHRVEEQDGCLLFVSKGNDGLAIRLSAPNVRMRIHNGDAIAEFVLKAGESAAFILELAEEGKESCVNSEDYVSESFKATVNYWRNWLSQCTYKGRWREMIYRSALTLKLLTYRKTGAIVAAPTFGIPEHIGGVRNWDYRYTWIRDASFTLYAFSRLGYRDETIQFMRWIEERCGELESEHPLNVMYGIDGRHKLTEETLDHLEGYMGSSPVRIGNGAYDQLQLDIYGELMDSIYLYDKYAERLSYSLWQRVTMITNWVCENYNQPDEGIWEVRSGKQHFLYSRLLCWVAVDRAVRLSIKRSLPAPLTKWQKTRDSIYQEIFEEFYDVELKSFVQYKGAKTLDASVLLMPLVRFISPTDPRWVSTMKAVEENLLEDSHVYRYRIKDENADGLPGEEGTFCMCTFWYVECLSRYGDIDMARFHFEKMLGYSNHLGLFSEELGLSGQHLGNFPQAFTHIALISAAYDLDRRLSDRGRG